MSNLPEGVTPAMIDRAFGGPLSDAWTGDLECDHEDRLGELWEEGEAGSYDDPGDPDTGYPPYLALAAQPTKFTDRTTDVTVWDAGGAVTVTWVCPACGRGHEETYDASDFADDTDPYED
jgi:hypothetical protein